MQNKTIALALFLLLVGSAYGAVWLTSGGDGSTQIELPSFTIFGNISKTPTPTPTPGTHIQTAYLTLNQRTLQNNYTPLLLLAIVVAFLLGYHLVGGYKWKKSESAPEKSRR